MISFALYSILLMAPFPFLFNGPPNKQHLGMISGVFGIEVRCICFFSWAQTLFFPHCMCSVSVFCMVDINMSVHLKLGGNNSRLGLWGGLLLYERLLSWAQPIKLGGKDAGLNNGLPSAVLTVQYILSFWKENWNVDILHYHTTCVGEILDLALIFLFYAGDLAN